MGRELGPAGGLTAVGSVAPAGAGQQWAVGRAEHGAAETVPAAGCAGRAAGDAGAHVEAARVGHAQHAGRAAAAEPGIAKRASEAGWQSGEAAAVADDVAGSGSAGHVGQHRRSDSRRPRCDDSNQSGHIGAAECCTRHC